jgi:hypothetical protein
VRRREYPKSPSPYVSQSLSPKWGRRDGETKRRRDEEKRREYPKSPSPYVSQSLSPKRGRREGETEGISYSPSPYVSQSLSLKMGTKRNGDGGNILSLLVSQSLSLKMGTKRRRDEEKRRDKSIQKKLLIPDKILH